VVQSPLVAPRPPNASSGPPGCEIRKNKCRAGEGFLVFTRRRGFLLLPRDTIVSRRSSDHQFPSFASGIRNPMGSFGAVNDGFVRRTPGLGSFGAMAGGTGRPAASYPECHGFARRRDRWLRSAHARVGFVRPDTTPTSGLASEYRRGPFFWQGSQPRPPDRVPSPPPAPVTRKSGHTPEYASLGFLLTAVKESAEMRVNINLLRMIGRPSHTNRVTLRRTS
jgi:hypothetical protein